MRHLRLNLLAILHAVVALLLATCVPIPAAAPPTVPERIATMAALPAAGAIEYNLGWRFSSSVRSQSGERI